MLIENLPRHITGWSDVRMLPGVLDALQALVGGSQPIVVVTNQSAIGLGLLTVEEAGDINARLLEQIESAGGRIDAVYMCPHTPAEGCDCRKPKPGMLLQAAEELTIDLAASLMIGDALTDLQAAWAAGVGRTALVRTGRGLSQEALAVAKAQRQFAVFDTLLEAVAGAWAAIPRSPYPRCA